MIRRRFIARSAALAGACIAPVSVRAQSAASVVRIGATATDDCAPIVYGQQSGLFARAGLDVQFDRLSSGSAAAAAVLSGAYDIGKASVPAVFDAHEKGLPFTLIGAAVIWDAKISPSANFLVTVDSPLRTGKDANGGTFGVASLSDIGRLAMTAWVERNGGDPSSLKFVEIPTPAGPAAVEQHRVTSAESSEPSLSNALVTGRFRVIDAFSAVAPTFLSSAWFTTRERSSQRSDVFRAFARALAQSAAYTNVHHEETAPLIAAFTGISIDVIRHMNRVLAGTTVDPKMLQPVIDAAAKYGTIKRRFAAAELIDATIT